MEEPRTQTRSLISWMVPWRYSYSLSLHQFWGKWVFRPRAGGGDDGGGGVVWLNVVACWGYLRKCPRETKVKCGETYAWS